MSPAPVRVTRSCLLAAAGLATTLLAAGCSQFGSAGYYNPPPESTVTDAQYHGQGAGYRTVVHAPSQLQIDLKPDAPRRPANTTSTGTPAPTATGDAAQAANPALADSPVPPLPPGGANARMVNRTAAATVAPDADAGGPVNPEAQAFMPQAQTYMGTFPCFSRSMQCQAEAQRVTLTLAPNGRWRARTVALEGQGKPVAEQGCWNVTGERPARLLLLDGAGSTRAELLATANNVLRVRSVLGNAPTLDYSLTRQPDLDPIDELVKQPVPACQ
ncbi:copper resistance protein NlpE [Bordetella genomosp. 13]|uniref:copper resistance protein NlpE n=1 Tax=Bordetella genomosp. 13 TaxID=463040 RepID=UPI0011A1AAC8|nr:copper resistance protein NlpE [Bordetella genomosp. 13]